MEEYNARQSNEVNVEPWTADEYKQELELLRSRGDPSIQV